MKSGQPLLLHYFSQYYIYFIFIVGTIVQARTAFEKLTDLEYKGDTYYTIRNLSLYECQGWCREEPECQSAAFSFNVKNGNTVQDTVCYLQNSTEANNPSATPTSKKNQYYMVKMYIRSDKVCKRPWNFERVPNKMIGGHDKALIFTSTKEACLGACLNERNFKCRSAEYNYVTLQCRLSDRDRRSLGDSNEEIQLSESPGVDYFENLCLRNEEACHSGIRTFDTLPGIPKQKLSIHVGLHYYVDKELISNSQSSCEESCISETEFLCRTYLYIETPSKSEYNCKLYHLDHWTIPSFKETVYNSYVAPGLVENGGRLGTVYENLCGQKHNGDYSTTENEPLVSTSSGSSIDEGGLYIGNDHSTTSSSYYSSSSSSSEHSYPLNDIDSDINCDKLGTCYDVTVHCKDTRIVVNVATNRPFSGRIYSLGRSETCNVDVINSNSFRLDLTMTGHDCNTQSVNGVYSNTVVVQRHSVVMTKTDKIYKVRCTYDTSSKNITFGMMPIRDPDMISITSAPEAPAPKISILDYHEKEVETVRIGDKLTFKIEIPDKTPYGIFARSCVAMAKDSKSTFSIIDENGCPVDPSIFPQFIPKGNALISHYEAFRFTESYGVIFQCNVKYCLGPCEPANCGAGKDVFESWGKKRRRRRRSLERKPDERESQMRLSHEIIVLDYGEENSGPDSFEQLSSSSFSSSSSNNTDYHLKPVNWKNKGFESENSFSVFEDCPSKTTVMSYTIGLVGLSMLYAVSLGAFCIKRALKKSLKENAIRIDYMR